MNTSFTHQTNPYIVGRPIGQDLLFGRESLFEDIRRYLQQHKHRVIVLYGQRRIGKSSVVRNITNQLKDLQQEFAFVTFSLEYYSQQSLGRILAELAQEFISDLSLDKENISIPEITELESDYGVFSNEFLPQVFQALNEKNLVLLLDDFDLFINDHPEISLKVFYQNLFSIIKKEEKLFLILLMDQKLLNSSKRIINKFEDVVTIQEIKLLDQSATGDLIKQPAQNILEYEEDAIQKIFDLSAGHPYFTQVICSAIFSRARENSNLDDKVHREDVEAIIDKAIELAEAGLSWFWQNFSVTEKVVLSAVAESQGNSEDYLELIIRNKADIDINLIIKTKEYLKENEFLDQTKDEKVKIELFSEWIIKTHPLNEEISELEKLTQKENQVDAQSQGANINENNNTELPLPQIIENTAINTSNIDSGIESNQPIELNQPISNHEVNREVNTPQRKLILLIIITIVGFFVSSIILATIYRLSTKPCPAGEKKEFGIRCVVDTSRISRGDKTLFPNISNRFRDQGIQAFKQGDYQQAAKLFEEAVKANQNDPEVRIYYNNALARQQGSPFTFAVVVPIDDKSTSDGKEILRGVAQAQEQFNNNKGLNGRLLEIVIANDGNTEYAKQVAQQLAKDSSILGVIGHNSSDATRIALPEYEKAKLPIISATSTSIFLNNPVFFRSVNSDENAGQKLAEYACQQLNLQKAVIFADPNSPYSNSIREVFTNTFEKLVTSNKKLPCQVVRKPLIDLTAANFDPAKEVYSEAALLFPDTQSTDIAIKIAEEITRINKRLKTPQSPIQEVKMLAGNTLYNHDKTLLEGGKNVEGLIIAIPWFRGTSAAKDFAKKSQQLWGGEVSWRTATSFDATQAFIKALSSKTSRQTVLERLKNVTLSPNETSGYPLQFTEEREREGEPVLVEVKNGQFVQIDESKKDVSKRQ